MSAKVERVLSEIASMSAAELEEFFGGARAILDPAFLNRVLRFSALNDNVYAAGRPPFNTGDLARLLKDLPADPSFADDIDAGIRARREADESRTSTWES